MFLQYSRNPLTVAGIVSKPLGSGIPRINVLHTFQQAPRSSPGEGHTNPVAQTRDSCPGGAFYLKKCHLLLAHTKCFSSSSQTHSWAFREDNSWQSQCSQDSLPGPSPQATPAQTPAPLGKYPVLGWPPGSSPAHSMSSIHRQFF